MTVLQVVHDMKVTMSQAVEPMEKGITRINETIQSWGGSKLKDKKRHQSNDDLGVVSENDVHIQKFRGIDDPLLTGSISDSKVWRARRSNADSSGESSDQGRGGFKTSGKRWTIKR
jgi:hypothetical protein